jgi:hypothetical protein
MANNKYIPKFQEGGGVSLSSLLAGSAKGWAAKNIAKKDTAQRKKEGTWAGIMSLLKPVAGFGSKALIGALGVTNPYLLPLLLGGGTAAISKIFDVVGRGAGAGADPSKITATGKYGYGEGAAKTLSEGLEESIKERDPFSKESVIADIVGSYVSALTPKINPLTGKVEGGELGKTITEDIGKWKEGKAAKSLIKARGSVPLDLEESFDMPFGDQFGATPQQELSDLWSPSEEWAEPIGEFQGPASPEQGSEFPPAGEGAIMSFPWFGGEKKYRLGLEQGGQVPLQSSQPRTILDYFGEQGMTLGGSNTQSIGQMLGRR